jgi:superfamily II DNA/RNA helicase
VYDAVTSALIAGAPALDGLDPGTLREDLTAAYVEIAAARLSLGEADSPLSPELTRLMGRMGRLADAYEARIVLDLDSDRRLSIAFVAGSARQFMMLASRLRHPGMVTTRLDEDAVGPEIAAALLFLIAERSSDAFEAAREIHAAGEPDPIRRALILALSRLARGRLQEIGEMDLPAERLAASDPFGYAADLLFRELLSGVILLARDGLGLAEGDGFTVAVAHFESVRRLSVAVDAVPDASIPAGLQAISTFAGPHHLAGLLLRAAGTFRNSVVVRTPAPGGVDVQRWREWLRGEARRWPYVWENHRRAIATGYLNCGQSMIMTSPTGSGKTTLAALKIAATITSGKTVLYLAPTHALVSQVERDLNERIGELATAESVDDTTAEDILPALPTLAVVTPERCFALLTFAPELFANVGLLVFDECHLLGVGGREDGAIARRVDRRGVDAMLCLLTFLATAPNADLLLLSAMVSNGPQVALWLNSLTSRPVHAFDDRWKPSRQLRCCVTYDFRELQSARVAANTKGEAARVAAIPLGLFSLVSGWNPGAPNKLLVRPLTPGPVALGSSNHRLGRRYLTANRFEVAVSIADRFERAGLKVIIFCDSIPLCVSTAKVLNQGRDAHATARDQEQEAWRDAAISELGGVNGIYDAGEQRAAVHHGELLPDERRLVETLFRNRQSGLNVLTATSTLAQGLNLPCEVVILAGTDRVDDSDPAETRRSPLAAHEILNALGRAGRAGQSATGFALVVPGKPIPCDPDSKQIARSDDLPIVFSEGDQCLPLADPLTTLFDQVEVAGVIAPEAQYLLRRLAVALGPNASADAFNGLARRTFGFYQKFTDGAAAAEAWLAQRRATLTTAIQATAEPPALPWEEELAAKTGATQSFIAGLAKAYCTAPRDAVDAEPWIDWLLGQFDPAHDDVDTFLRPDTMARVFSRAYTTQPDDTAKRRIALLGVRAMLKPWFAGEPLLQLEARLAGFIIAYEIGVNRPSRADAKAKHARRFALRLAPDLGFLCGVIGQVGAKRDADEGKVPPPMLQFLPQLVRRGYATPYHFALSQGSQSASRVEIHQAFAGVAEQLQRSASDDWSTVREKLLSAQINLNFDNIHR